MDQTPVRTLRPILLGWGVTSFGAVHRFIDDVGLTLIFHNGPEAAADWATSRRPPRSSLVWSSW